MGGAAQCHVVSGFESSGEPYKFSDLETWVLIMKVGHWVVSLGALPSWIAPVSASYLPQRGNPPPMMLCPYCSARSTEPSNHGQNLLRPRAKRKPSPHTLHCFWQGLSCDGEAHQGTCSDVDWRPVSRSKKSAKPRKSQR